MCGCTGKWGHECVTRPHTLVMDFCTGGNGVEQFEKELRSDNRSIIRKVLLAATCPSGFFVQRLTHKTLASYHGISHGPFSNL